MGLFLTPNLRICYQYFLPVLRRNITLLTHSHNDVSTCFKVGGLKPFCTKNFKKNVVAKRNDFKPSNFVIKERPAFPKSVFAAGHARRTAFLLKKKAGTSDTEEPPDRVEKKYALEIPHRPLSASEWKKLKEESKKTDRFEIRIMEQMLSTGADINIAKSLLAYVAVDTGTVPYELLLRYLTVCVHGEHWTEMYDVYDIMKGRFRTLDTSAYTLLIKGFSKTERWEETLVFIDNINKVITPSSRNYSDAISGAVQHGRFATAWTLYDQLLERGLNPNQETWKYLFEAGISDQENDDRLLSVLEHMRDNQVYPQDSLAQVIRKWFECHPNQKFAGSISTVNPSGVCQGCGSVLESIHLTEEDYADLKNSVMKNVIEGKDVFKKTTPEELESFKHFVSKRPPFDVVIDGLNVAHTLGRGTQSETLLAVVSEFSRQGLSILVLGRKHMLRPTQSWNHHHMKQIQQKAHCFFTENISEDDPFLLYAALHSGNHCNFVSRDLMRDHKACLPSGHTRRLFFKWQRGHQLVLHNYVPGKRVCFQKIQSYDTIIQTTANTWHIPFDEDSVERCTHEVPQKWLCLTRQN